MALREMAGETGLGHRGRAAPVPERIHKVWQYTLALIKKLTLKSEEDNIARFLLLCGVSAPIMMMSIIVVLGQITPDYSPVSDTISQMGAPGRPYAIFLNGGYVIYGISIALAACGLYRSISSTATAKRLMALLCIHAMGTVLLGTCPDSLDLLPKHFTDDLLHNIFSAVSYLPLLIGILMFRKVARQEKALKAAGILGLAIVIICLPMPTITLFEPFKPISGLLQRVLCGSSFLWLTLTFFLLYRKRHRLQSRFNNHVIPYPISLE